MSSNKKRKSVIELTRQANKQQFAAVSAAAAVIVGTVALVV
jgi:hypothetical protein